jgi:hypothetical protein
MPENMDKWASGNRKIAKSGHRVAAEMIPFPRRWHGSMISADPVAIWGMSAKCCHPVWDTDQIIVECTAEQLRSHHFVRQNFT